MFPPTGFHFRVLFKGLDDPEQLDSSFQSVGGLEAHASGYRSEEAQAHETLTQDAGPSILTLKRAARQYSESALLRWLFSHFNKLNKDPWKEASIELLNEEHQPFMIFTIRNILPKSWRLGELNAMKTEVLLETIELYYEELLPGKI